MFGLFFFSLHIFFTIKSQILNTDYRDLSYRFVNVPWFRIICHFIVFLIHFFLSMFQRVVVFIHLIESASKVQIVIELLKQIELANNQMMEIIMINIHAH